MTTSQGDEAARLQPRYSAVSRAMRGPLDAARQVNEKGGVGYLERSLTAPELNAFVENQLHAR